MFTIDAPKNKPISIYGTIRPLYIVARFCGFFPFTLKTDKSGACSVHFTIIDSVIFFIQISIYLCLTCVHIVFDLMRRSSMSPILALGTRIGLIFGLMNSVGFLVAEIFNRHQIIDVFKMYQDFDSQLKLLGSSLNNRMNNRYLNIYVLVCGIIGFIYTTLSFWLCKDFFELIALLVCFPSFYLSAYVSGISLSIYSFFIFNVASRYTLLNDILGKLPTKTTDLSVVQMSTAHSVDSLMKLASLHDLLNSILDKVNRCYSIQAMLGFGISFTYVVFSMFSIYRGWIMKSANNEQLNLSIVMTLWTSYYIIFEFIVLWAGDSSKSEGKFTGVLVHRAINQCHNAAILERLMTFSSQINSRTPDANCKLFSFDWTLIFSIVAAKTTYLIILIQFDTSGDEPKAIGSNNFTLSN